MDFIVHRGTKHELRARRGERYRHSVAFGEQSKCEEIIGYLCKPVATEGGGGWWFEEVRIE